MIQLHDFVKVKLLFLLMYFLCNTSIAQDVEHNFRMGPQSTNCDSTRFIENDVESLIEQIRQTKFRYDRSFKLTRKQGLKGGEYYSCDNLVGFLIIKYDDEEFVYSDVEKSVWNEFISSSDPEGFFLQMKELRSSGKN